MDNNTTIKRIFEILPASLAWFMWSVPVLGAIFFPIFSIYLILLIDIYALYKSLTFNYFFYVSYRRINYWNSVDWNERLKALGNIKSYKSELESLANTIDSSHIKDNLKLKSKLQKIILANRFTLNLLKSSQKSLISDEIESLEHINDNLDYKNIVNVVIIPFWKEGYEVLAETLNYIKDQTYPSKEIIVVLGAEARYEPAMDLAKRLQKNYSEYFREFLISNHVLTIDEIIGKAANVNAAGRMVAERLGELGIKDEDVIFTSCDSDSLFPQQYFSSLVYNFLISKNKHKTIFASPMQYTANYHRLYAFSRVVAMSNSISNISMCSREHHFMPVSTYSASLKLYRDIDFWSVDVIPEDFHTFMKTLFILGDKVRAKTIYLPILSDTAEGHTVKDSFINQYEQEKRWAWGTSDHFWMAKTLIKRFTWYKFYRVFNVFHQHYIWGFLGFVVLIGANFITYLNADISNTVIAVNITTASSLILTLTLIPFTTSIIMMYLITDMKSEPNKLFVFLKTLFFWLTFPFISLLMRNIPGLDSQSRLMLGKYMEYRLTEKPR